MQAAVIFFAVAVLCLAQNDPRDPENKDEWRLIRQSDFDSGTYRITTPGYYRLAENIVFNPRAPTAAGIEPVVDAYDAYKTDSKDWATHDKWAYQIGFWAAITIETTHVTLDLSGFSIAQHKEHNLMNRYFNVIELATQPFLMGQGFTNFGQTGELAVETLIPAHFVTIRNGVVGRAATNGIHGTGNTYIEIEKVRFVDFESAAVSLYGATNVVINRCTAKNSVEVPVNSLWDTALNLRPFINFLATIAPDYSLKVQGEAVSAITLQGQLRELVNAVWNRVVIKKKWLELSTKEAADPANGILLQATRLFQNDYHKPDGNCFGFSVTSRNYDVDGFPYGYREVDVPSQYINITNCEVQRLACAPSEVVALTSHFIETVTGPQAIPLLDPRGHVVSLLNMVWDYAGSKDIALMENATTLTISQGDHLDFSSSVYMGTPVSNAQALIGKAIYSGILNESLSDLHVRRSTINRDFIAWIEADPSTPAAMLSTYTDALITVDGNERNWICNGDEIYRIQMGVAAYRVASTWDVYLYKNKATSVANYAWRGAKVCGYSNETRSHPNAVFTGYLGADARGFALASVRRTWVVDCALRDVRSYWGSVYAMDVLTDSSDVMISGTTIREGWAGAYLPYSGLGANNALWAYSEEPTRFPAAVGIHTDQRSMVHLSPYCVNGLFAPLGNAYKTALAPSTMTTWNKNVTDGEWANCHYGGEPWWIWLVLAVVCLIFVLALVALIMACMGGGNEAGSYQEMKG